MALFEVADLIGLGKIPVHQRRPLDLETRGIGELICYLIKQGKKEIYIGVGGTATNDGGLGLVAGLGYLSVFGSSTNTLLAPIFIGVEVFGPANAVPYAIVMAFAYLINHKTSIYGQQKMLEMQ